MKKAIPTEYDGVRFRSKSEAIFARMLTLRGKTWEYEPRAFGGKMDFYYTEFHRGHREHVHCFIEYKPTRPTESYLEHKIEVVYDDFHALVKCGLRVGLWVIYGNAFDSNKIEGWWLTLAPEWLDMPRHEIDAACPKHLLVKAADYRFDLISNAREQEVALA